MGGFGGTQAGRRCPTRDRLDTTKTLELLWKDELVADDESGSNRQLGFLFLYQLLKGAVGLSIGSTGVPGSGRVVGWVAHPEEVGNTHAQETFENVWEKRKTLGSLGWIHFH